MVICSKCGFKCNDGSKFCTKCANKLVQEKGKKEKVNEKFVSNTNIFLADGEVNVKSYHCTTFPNNFLTRFLCLATDGYISVTNKRVIFYSDGKVSQTISEVDIDKVGGIVGHSGKGWNLLALVAWFPIYIFLAVFTLFQFELLSSMDDFSAIPMILISLVLIGITAYVGWLFIRPWLYKFYVTDGGLENSQVGTGSVGNKTNWWVIGAGQNTSKSVRILFPAKDSEKAMRELRTVVKDIQTLREFGIEKWTVKKGAKDTQTINIEKQVVVETGNETGEFF